jgi:carboxypeptidase C (cathepsin A)
MKFEIAATVAFASVHAAHMTLANDNCTESAHYVGQLPYWKSIDGSEHPCSYAGTLVSNEAHSHHTFYWMYPNEDPEAPLAIWLNGGPGASSTFANFLLNGPLGIDHFGPADDEYAVYLKEQGSWADIAHMVYVD